MRRVLRVAVALTGLALGASGAMAETEDVDCGMLENLAIANLDQYDFASCAMGGNHDRASDGYVASTYEVMIAANRATFVALRYEAAGRYTFFHTGRVADFIPGMLDMPMRNWGSERKHERFALAPVEIKISDDSPYLSCYGYVRRWGVVGLAPGHKFILAGVYCAMDTLEPTDGEIEEFLDGVAF
jgi:hypothetical protein